MGPLAPGQKLKPLRVLQVIPSVAASDGGPTKAIALIERSLSEVGVSVTTLTTDHDLRGCEGLDRALSSEHVNGATRIYVHKWTGWYKIAPRLVTYLARHIRSFDIVHVHALFSFSSTMTAWMARANGVPYIIRPLGTLGSYGTQNRRRLLKSLSLAWIERPNLRAAAAVHFTSRAEMDEATALGLPFRGVVIPLGIEEEVQTPPTELHAEFPLLKDRRAVLFLSRLDPKKNVEALIDAFANSEELKRTSMLVIAGSGNADYVDRLKARADAARLGGCIVWLGHVAGARKSAAFAAADVFVLPSFSENFGIAAVEAMLAGLPCVLSPGVAIARDAADAGAAILAEPEPAAVARAILDVLRGNGTTGSMGAYARAYARAAYSPLAMARSLVGLYTGILSAKRTQAA